MSWHSGESSRGVHGASEDPPTSWTRNDTLDVALGTALTEAPLADRVTATARSAFRVHRAALAARDDLELDLMLLTLVHDSSEAHPVGVRDRSGGTSRTLVFQGDGLGVEVEVANGSIEGQLIPPHPGRVTLRDSGGSADTVTTDEVGCFRFETHPRGPLRLECLNSSGTCATEWLPW